MESRSPNSSEDTTKNRFTTFLHQLEESVGDSSRAFVIDDDMTPRGPWEMCNRISWDIPTYFPKLKPVETFCLETMAQRSFWQPWTIFEELCVKATLAYQSKLFDANNRYHHAVCDLSVVTREKCETWEQQCSSLFPTCFNEEDILMWACFLCVSLRNTSRPDVSLMNSLNVFEHRPNWFISLIYVYISTNAYQIRNANRQTLFSITTKKRKSAVIEVCKRPINFNQSERRNFHRIWMRKLL